MNPFKFYKRMAAGSTDIQARFAKINPRETGTHAGFVGNGEIVYRKADGVIAKVKLYPDSVVKFAFPVEPYLEIVGGAENITKYEGARFGVMDLSGCSNLETFFITSADDPDIGGFITMPISTKKLSTINVQMANMDGSYFGSFKSSEFPALQYINHCGNSIMNRFLVENNTLAVLLLNVSASLEVIDISGCKNLVIFEAHSNHALTQISFRECNELLNINLEGTSKLNKEPLLRFLVNNKKTNGSLVINDSPKISESGWTDIETLRAREWNVTGIR